MTFTITKLTGSRALIQGTDILGTDGKTVVSTEEWDGIQAHKDLHVAGDAFDAAVEEFFAPLNEAAEKLKAAGMGKAIDEDTFVVLHEGTEPVEGVAPVVSHLSHDSIVLRLIERGDGDRLVWVNDQLEILERAETPAPVQVDEAAVTE